MAMSFMLALAAQAAAQAGAMVAGAPSPLPQGDTPQIDEVIQADYEASNRMTVPVMIDGQGPFRFMIDTGAQATVVTRGMEEQLNLAPLGQAMLVGMAGRELVDLVDLDQLMLGSRMLNNIEAPVLERRHVGADGIIGLDSLQDLRVLLDFRDQSIAVADAKDLGGNQGFEIIVRARRREGQLLIANAEIDGVKTAVIVDTGSQSTVGNLALKRKLRSRLQGTAVSTDVLGNDLTGDVGVAGKLEIDGMSLVNVVVTYNDTPAFEALGLTGRPALALGMDHLRMFDRVAIDFSTKQVLFDLPRNVRRPVLGDLFLPRS